MNFENLSFEEKILQTQEQLKQVISQSGLNVSVLELIMRNLYNEVKDLALQNLQNKIRERNEKQQQAMMEELKDGDTDEERTAS